MELDRLASVPVYFHGAELARLGSRGTLRQLGRINEWAVYLFTALFTLASFLFFALVPLPRAYYPELFFGRPEDLIPAVFFAIALWGYLRK